MSNTICVLVSGKQFSGKDTVANYIASQLPVSQRTSFAAALKKTCADVYGLDYDRLMNDQAYKNEHRQKLIDHGKAKREEDLDYWVRTAYESAVKEFDEKYPSAGTRIIIISDWRFPNEYKWFADRQFTVIPIRVSATDAVRASRGWKPTSMDSDISECALDDFSANEMCKFENNATVDDLYRSVLGMVEIFAIKP